MIFAFSSVNNPRSISSPEPQRFALQRFVLQIGLALAGLTATWVDIGTNRALAAGVSGHATPTGKETGLPLPRYVSLKSDRVNLRQGPAKEHKTLWVFRKAGLPVEITAEFENWRRIRDADGDEGWVLHSLLSGRRTAMVAPWGEKGLLDLHASPADDAAVTAHIEAKVVVNIRTCDRQWCRISGKNFDGYIRQKKLWGVYPDEPLN